MAHTGACHQRPSFGMPLKWIGSRYPAPFPGLRVKHNYDGKGATECDVIQGLPNDSAEWLKKTLTYATSLGPNSIQLKQFYLNPFTLFHVEREKYGIVTEELRDPFDKDFDAPYVVQANGVDEDYFKETSDFIRNHIAEHSKIRWKYLSKRERYVSKAFFPASKRGVSYRAA